jgi:hypothetical protein
MLKKPYNAIKAIKNNKTEAKNCMCYELDG